MRRVTIAARKAPTTVAFGSTRHGSPKAQCIVDKVSDWTSTVIASPTVILLEGRDRTTLAMSDRATKSLSPVNPRSAALASLASAVRT